jgi:hypothetical protein
MTNFDEWRELELRAVGTINEFSAMGVRVPTGKGTPMTTAGILANQTARAFDAALDDDVDQGFGFRGRRAVDNDDEPDERAVREAYHRTLDRAIDWKRHRARDTQPASGGEIPSRWQDLDSRTQRLVLMNVLRTRTTEDAAQQSQLPLRVLKDWLVDPAFQEELNALWSRFVARAADARADEEDDLQHFRRLAFDSSGCM